MEKTVDLATTVNAGLQSLFTIAPIVTLLVLIVICQLWFIRFLLNEAKEERKLNREALNNSTAVISELKEMIRNAITR